MVTYQEAIVAIHSLALTKNLGIEKISIENSLNRVISEDLLSPEDVPSFNNSAMDGFAICSQQTRKANLDQPVRLQVVDTIAAGEFVDKIFAQPNTCIEIMTGAPVPDQYDAVIKIEDVEICKDEITGVVTIQIKSPVKQYENIRYKGEDYKAAGPLLYKATTVMPEHIMALATLGQSHVQVYKRPKIVIVSTGKELVHYSTQKLKYSQIRNSSSIFLTSFLNHIGCDVEFAGMVNDDPKEFFELIKKIETTKPDVILTTGAVSMGKYDFIKAALADLGAEILFHKVSIRPGKPVLFAKLSSSIAFFGLPGNPISTAVGARFFLTPYLKTLLKQKAESPLKAILTKETKKPEGLRCFFKAQVNFTNHTVECLPGQASFMVSPFTRSNAWLICSEHGNKVEENTEIDIYPLYPLQYNWGNL